MAATIIFFVMGNAFDRAKQRSSYVENRKDRYACVCAIPLEAKQQQVEVKE